MTDYPVFDQTGKEVGRYQIDYTDLAPRICRQLLHDAVVMYQANLRVGTFKTKTRGEVAGTTKKMYRQKGTGNARAGSRRSGVRRGGGHIHAKQPRDFSYRLPRKALRLATRMAIASKVRDGELVILDDLSLSKKKTSEVYGILKSLNLTSTRLLVATAGHDPELWRCSRNIPKVEVAAVADLNALSVLTPAKVLITKATLDGLRAKKVGG